MKMRTDIVARTEPAYNIFTNLFNIYIFQFYKQQLDVIRRTIEHDECKLNEMEEEAVLEIEVFWHDSSERFGPRNAKSEILQIIVKV